jgi:SET family sugar efflux transporter-like MFS transporter
MTTSPFARTNGWVVPALATFLVGVQQSAFLVHLSVFADQVLHLGPASLSILVFSFHASSMLSSLGIMWTSDRIGHRMRIFGVLCGFSLVGYSCLLAVREPAAAVTVLALCLGPTASQTALLFAHLRAENGPPQRIVSVRAAFSAAWVVGPAAGAAIWATFGATGLLSFLLAISCALAMISLAFRSNAPSVHAAAVAGVAARTNWFGLGLAFVAFAALQGTTTGALTIVPLVLAKELPTGAGTAGPLFSLCALLEVPMLIFLGKAAERWGAPRVLLLGCTFGTTYYLVLWTTQAEWTLYAAQILNAFFIAAIVGPGLVWFQNLAPERVGLATALFLNAYNAGGLAITPLIGWIATSTGTYQPVAGALAVIVVCSAVPLAALRVRRSNPNADFATRRAA